MSSRPQSADRRPDVVLSYARNTASLARATHKFLRSAGLDVWFDEVSLRSGDHWLAAHYRALTWARHHLILLTDRTSPSWALATFDYAARGAALNRSLETIPLLREGYEPGPVAERLARYEVAHLAHDKDRLDTQLRALVQRLRDQTVRPAAPHHERVNPYPALRPHGVGESRFFFGRDREVSEAIARLGTQSDGRHRRWLRIFGPPGVGKTSFARAGVVPAVLRGGVQGAPLSWRVAAVRLGDDPLAALADGVARALAQGARSADVARDLRTAGLAEVIHEQLPADHGLLLVIDHLEDVDGRAVEPAAIARLDTLLADALADFDQRLFLVTAERVDLAELVEARLPRTAALLASHGALYGLAGLTRDGLKAIVEGPAALVGQPWPPPLARRLLDDAERQPAGPASLSWMLSALMVEERPSIQAYEARGTLAAGVGRACDRQIELLSEEDRVRARGLLCALVEVGRGRGDRPTSVGIAEAVTAAGEGPRAEALLERLEAGIAPESGPATPLLRVEGPDGRRRVRLAHWALLRLWPRLARFVEEDRPVLERREIAERAAARWVEGGRDEKALPRDAELAHLAGEDLAETQRRRLRAVLPAEVRGFIESAELAEIARKEREEAAREASHEAALAAVAGERDAARASASRRGTFVVLLALLALSLAAWAVLSQAEIEALDGQLASAQDRLRARAAQQKKAEDDLFTAQAARVEAERKEREIDRLLRRSRQSQAEAEHNAEALIALVLDTWSRGDELMGRVPGNDGKYVRRLFTVGQLDTLGKQVVATPDNPRLRLLLARQQLMLADRATGAKNRVTRGEHLLAAVEALRPLAEGGDTPAPWLEALAEAEERLGRFLVDETGGVPDAGADFARGREVLEGAIATYDRLAAADAANAARWKSERASVKATLGRLAAATGQPDAARTLLGEAVAETRALVDAAPADAALALALARRLATLGEAETTARAWAAARQAFEAAAAITAPLADADPEGDAATVQRRIRRGLSALPPAP
ncbi:MAG: TIR domain-containing protein [bacterium]